MSHSGIDLTAQLKQLRPDVLHIHNTFPNISNKQLSKLKAPKVLSLHNYRSVCASGTLFLHGHECESCLKGSSFSAVKNRCYRESTVGSGAMAIRTRNGFYGDPLLTRADRILVPSTLMQEKFASIGVRTSLMLQPVDNNPFRETTAEPTGPWLFIGRLSHEKGILQLLDVWPSGEPLNIIGSGPLHEVVETHPRLEVGDVQLLGHVTEIEKARIMRDSRGLVFPSQWIEGAPAVFPEMLAAGRPVLAYRGNSVAREVSQLGVGTVFDSMSEDAVMHGLRDIDAHREAMERRIKDVFARDYSIPNWALALENMYKELLR